MNWIKRNQNCPTWSWWCAKLLPNTRICQKMEIKVIPHTQYNINTL